MLPGTSREATKRKSRNEEVSDSREQRPGAAKNGNLSATDMIRGQLMSRNLLERMERDESFHRLMHQDRIALEMNQCQNNNAMLFNAASHSSRPEHRPEDFPYGSRKITKSSIGVPGLAQYQADMSFQNVLESELRRKHLMDAFPPHVGSLYMGPDFPAGSSNGANDDDAAVDMMVLSSDQSTTIPSQHKGRPHSLVIQDNEQGWWWMESTSYRNNMLIALGNHVSLTMAPAHLSRVEGEQLFLVPIKHTEALDRCGDDVWNEISRFQSCLRAMYAKEGRGVIFSESVIASSTGRWQAQMEVTPSPVSHAQDSPNLFKGASPQQAEQLAINTNRKQVFNFLLKWKPFDFTLHLE